ncbi:unnamed protein product, partial [Brassica rapa]
KDGYSQWGPDETKLLIDLLVDAFHRNWRDDNGLINNFTVEGKKILVLIEKLGCQQEHKHYLKKKTNLFGSQRFNSGFGWDHDTKRFTAPDEVWDEYLKHLWYDWVEKYEDLQLIFGNGVANSGFVIGMGDSTDARTFIVEETMKILNYHLNNHQWNVVCHLFQVQVQKIVQKSFIRGRSQKGKRIPM